MMGRSQKTEPKLFYHGISLDRRVPADPAVQNVRKLLRYISGNSTNLAASATRATVQTLLSLQNLLKTGWNRRLNLS
jgi:hypothetical protein